MRTAMHKEAERVLMREKYMAMLGNEFADIVVGEADDEAEAASESRVSSV